MSKTTEHSETGVTLQEFIELMWGGKWIVAFCAALAVALAVGYLIVATPIYQVDALVQVEEKSGGMGNAVFGELGAMFDISSPAETEIEIIKSRMVLGRVVEQLNLDIVSRAQVWPIVGDYFLQKQHPETAIRVESFDPPQPWLGKATTIKLVNANSYELYFEKQKIATGTVGESLRTAVKGDSLQLFISVLQGKTGQEFKLIKNTKLKAIDAVNENLKVVEKGKKTGILALTFQHKNVDAAAEIINNVARNYVRQNVDRKSEEAAKTLEFLQSKLPDLKIKAEEAETKLNEYRLQVGSIDLNTESRLILDQGVDLESKLLILQQQKAEMLRLYKEDHPTVQTLLSQENRLKEQMRSVGSQVKKLPKTQQEILRLAQESKVAAELYNTMLENAQQLEVAKAGQVGNVRVIDYAMPSYKPVKPRKAITLAIMFLLGIFVAAGFILLRHLWNKGIEDPKVLESEFGLPVYASIPHSEVQKNTIDRMRRNKNKPRLLAYNYPDDTSVESFRSLRTTLHFSMHDAPNNILLLVGPSPIIGKSFVSANLATVLAQSGKKVCLIDADMRRGKLHEVLGVKREGGLSDYLSNSLSVSKLIKSTEVENLSILTTGQIPPNPSELLLSARTQSLLEELSESYDIVLVDSAPILAVADALILAKLAGSTLMVLKHASHSKAEIEQSLARFAHADIKIKGSIFNNVQKHAQGRYGYGAYHYKY